MGISVCGDVMMLRRLAAVLIGSSLFCVASGAVGQTVSPSKPVTHSEYYSPSQISPSDVPPPVSPSDAPPPGDTPLLQPSDIDDATFQESELSCKCSAPCGDCGCEPYRMFADGYAGFSARGWLNFGVTANDRNPPSSYNGPQGLNDRNEFQANQTYLVLERPVDPCGSGWSYGGRVDLLFGTDYVVTEQVGWEQTQTGAPQWNNRSHYGFSTPQAYVEAANGDFSIKLGRFYTLMGYESVMAPENFFYSHSYSFTNGSPFTHAGGMATWRMNDEITLSGGVVNGWDRFDGVDNTMGFLGGFQYRPECSDYSISGMVVADHEVAALRANRDARTLVTMLFDYNYSENTQLVLQFDGGRHKEGGPAPGLDAEWYGLTQYVYYTVNDCWKLGARFEWFRDDDGARVGGIRIGNPAPTGLVGDFYEVSVGANWSRSANFLLRPEMRWDWFEGVGTPYDDGTQTEQLTFAIDAIWNF